MEQLLERCQTISGEALNSIGHDQLHGEEAKAAQVKYLYSKSTEDWMSFLRAETIGQWKDPVLVTGSLLALSHIAVGALNSVAAKGVTKLGAYDLEITHGLTKSKNAFAKLKADIKLNGIQEPIKFVEHNGPKN